MPRIFFADDSRQRRPSRPGMGELISVGGFGIPIDRVRRAELDLEELCKQTGIPDDQSFKWSPEKGTWMHSELTGDDRLRFFHAVAATLAAHSATISVVVEDTKNKPAKPDRRHELDATMLFLERCHTQCGYLDGLGLVLLDRPAGPEKERDAFLVDCINEIEQGNQWVGFENLILPPITVASRHLRLLQAADVVVSATLAFVSGQNQVAPEVFERLRPLLESGEGRRGGIGLKIQPDYRYRNLYYWLLGDARYVNKTKADNHGLPDSRFPYDRDAGGEGKQATKL